MTETVLELENKELFEKESPKGLRSLKLHLQVDATKKKGILTHKPHGCHGPLQVQSSRVSVLHISSKGDALVNDGTTILMIPAAAVSIVDDDEDAEGRKRLEFVKRIYNSILEGDIIDTAAVYLEIQKWLL